LVDKVKRGVIKEKRKEVVMDFYQEIKDKFLPINQ